MKTSLLLLRFSPLFTALGVSLFGVLSHLSSVAHADGFSHAQQEPNIALQAAREAFTWIARHNMTSSEYQATFNDLVGVQGYNLIQVSGYAVGSQAQFAAIWNSAPTGYWQARQAQTPPH